MNPVPDPGGVIPAYGHFPGLIRYRYRYLFERMKKGDMRLFQNFSFYKNITLIAGAARKYSTVILITDRQSKQQIAQ